MYPLVRLWRAEKAHTIQHDAERVGLLASQCRDLKKVENRTAYIQLTGATISFNLSWKFNIPRDTGITKRKPLLTHLLYSCMSVTHGASTSTPYTCFTVGNRETYEVTLAEGCWRVGTTEAVVDTVTLMSRSESPLSPLELEQYPHRCSL